MSDVPGYNSCEVNTADVQRDTWSVLVGAGDGIYKAALTPDEAERFAARILAYAKAARRRQAASDQQAAERQILAEINR